MEIKICHVSDSHNRHKQIEIEPCDILIHSGDFSGRGRKSEVENFIKWFSKQTQATQRVFIAGNHDVSFDPKFERETEASTWLKDLLEDYCLNTGTHYLENSSINLFGLNIWGSPVTPWFHGDKWAFNKHRGANIREVWDKIPYNTDIVVTHGPISYKLDYTLVDKEYVGCEDLRYKIKQIKPKLHLSGHVHEGYGMDYDEDTIYSNACICNHQYEPINKPNIITIEI